MTIRANTTNNTVNLEKIAEKIAKLLKLAEGNANEAESQAAWVKAQELASQYQLDLEALRQTGDAPAAEMVEEAAGNPKSAWHKLVLMALCKANACVPLKGGKTMYVLGEKTDVALVLALAEAIRKQVEHLSKLEMKAQGTAKIAGWGHAYRTGMATRVIQRIREAAQTVQSTGTALVLARDTRARDFMEQKYAGQLGGTSSVRPQAHGAAMGLGFSHGDRVQLHKAVSAA